MVYPPADGHPKSTNRARRWLSDIQCIYSLLILVFVNYWRTLSPRIWHMWSEYCMTHKAGKPYVVSCQDQQTVHFSEATLWESSAHPGRPHRWSAYLASCHSLSVCLFACYVMLPWLANKRTYWGLFIRRRCRARMSDQLLCDLMLAKCNSK